MCHYCKLAIKKDNMPPRCVLNGLKVVEVPNELAKLDCLSRQFIQRAAVCHICSRTIFVIAHFELVL